MAFCSLGVGSAGAAKKDIPTLNVVLSTSVVDYAQWLSAKALGFWPAEGVNVNQTLNGGTNTINLVVGGQYDLATFTGASGAQVALQGKPISGILSTEINPGSALISSSDISSVAAMKTASNCRWATSAIGSTAYWSALIYQRELGVVNKCTLVPLATTGLQVQGVVAGAYQAAIVGMSVAYPALSQGAHLLIDPTSSTYQQTYGRTNYQAGLIWGLKDNVAAKKDAIISFIRGAFDGAEWCWTHNDRQVAQMISKFPEYSGLTVDQMVPLIGWTRLFVGNNTSRLAQDWSTPNYMTAAEWKRALEVFGQFGLQGFDPNSPLVQYGQVINMGYYHLAFPKPNLVVDASHRTLSQLAAANLGSASKWQQLYNANKVWFDTLGLKQSAIPNAKLRIGTVVAQSDPARGV
jgi:ABC-type nitrate/sulfonate/bicarbonate transport system substrate-binding protein